MKKKIAIHCIGNNMKGFGNFNRSLVLAKSLKKFSMEPFFIIYKNNIMIDQLIKNNIRYLVIKKSKNLVSEKIKEILIKENFSCIILDARELNEVISKEIAFNEFKVVVIDDAWVNKAYADILVNGTPIREYHSYKKINQNCKFLLGPKYWIMDENFKKNRKNLSEIISKRKYHVLISMGGSDYHDMTKKILLSLLTLNQFKISVIIGPFYKNKKNLLNIIKNYKNVKVIDSPKMIWKKFQKSDIIISAAGSTLFELVAQGIPSISVETIEHQIPYGKFFKSQGVSFSLGFWKDFNSDVLHKNLIKILNNPEKRKKMSQKGIKIFDGIGAKRVAQEVSNLLKIYKIK